MLLDLRFSILAITGMHVFLLLVLNYYPLHALGVLAKPEVTSTVSWINLGGQSRQLAVGNNEDGRLALFSIGLGDGFPYLKRELANGTWSKDWVNLGGQSRQLAVGNNEDGRLALFSIGRDATVYTIDIIRFLR